MNTFEYKGRKVRIVQEGSIFETYIDGSRQCSGGRNCPIESLVLMAKAFIDIDPEKRIAMDEFSADKTLSTFKNPRAALDNAIDADESQWVITPEEWRIQEELNNLCNLIEPLIADGNLQAARDLLDKTEILIEQLKCIHGVK